MNQVEYHDLRADQAEASRMGASSLYQQCQRCGLCEMAGGYCSHCTTAEYDLLAHLHDAQRADTPVCPLDRVLTYGTTTTLGIYHHVSGASLARFPVARREASEAQLAALAKTRARRTT